MPITPTEPLDWPTWLHQRMDQLGLIPRVLASQVGRGERIVTSWRSETGSLPPSTVHDVLASALGVQVPELRLRIHQERRRRSHAAESATPVSA